MVISENMNGVRVGWRFNQHHSSRSDKQPGEHIYGARRACHHHQVPRLNREALFSIDFFYKEIDKATRSLLCAVLERRIELRRDHGVLHGIEQFRGKKRRRVRVAKQQ